VSKVTRGWWPQSARCPYLYCPSVSRYTRWGQPSYRDNSFLYACEPSKGL
ncbi:hypothetical protein COCCADRAFT_110678, partial [Bipolaris zeicola 26-R-13]